MAFVTIKKTLENVLKEYDIKGDIDAHKIFYLWDDIVGEKTASHTKPARIGNNILFVEVDDPIWLTQLRYMKMDILEKIEGKVKKGLLKDLKFYLRRN
jgi:predicted nucleic acid-binding Zn ribbon protein